MGAEMSNRMNIVKMPIADLKPAEYNPRIALKKGDAEYEKLKRSIENFGYVEPVIFNKTTGNIVGGHQRLTVLRDMGETEIDCVVVELDANKEKALNIALNKIQGEWDKDKLITLISELDTASFDVSLTGFDGAEVDELMDAFYSREAIQDDFDIDKEHGAITAKGSVVKEGDIVLLGRHRLMCGDTTKAEDITVLMKGQKAQTAVTSPPYVVGKEYETKGIDAWFETIRPAVKNITKYADIVCWNLADYYCTGTQFIEPTTAYSVEMFKHMGFRPIWIRIWKKQGQNHGVGPYHLVTNKPVQQYEYISAFGNKAETEYNDQEYNWISAYAGHSYKFVKRLTKDERKKWGYAGVWEISSVRANKEHPAMYPVELPWRCIKMHSDKGGIVLEPFSGSGTTIIACEQTDRICFAMEKENTYVETAVKRWIDFVGKSEEVFVLRGGQKIAWGEICSKS